MLVILATSTDEPSIEETILTNVLRLMKKDMPDNVKMLTQYFQFFILYSAQGRQRVNKLLKNKFKIIILSFSVNN
jgi:hypothetical protein